MSTSSPGWGLRWATWLFIVVHAVFTIGSLFTVSLPAHSFDVGKLHLGLFLVQFGAVQAARHVRCLGVAGTRRLWRRLRSD